MSQLHKKHCSVFVLPNVTLELIVAKVMKGCQGVVVKMAQGVTGRRDEVEGEKKVEVFWLKAFTFT